MNLNVGKRIPSLKKCYELIINYANRDDELVFISKVYQDVETVVEVLEVLIEGLSLEYMNGEKYVGDIPNFGKYFEFQDIGKKFPGKHFEGYDSFCDDNWFNVEGEDKSEQLNVMYYEKYPERKGIEPILWDYLTCSGEVPLEISSWELYLYDEDGNKRQMEVTE